MPTKMQHCIRFLWANDIDMQAKSNQFKYIHHALQSANTEIKNNLLITEFKNNLSVRRCVFVAYQSEKYVNFQHGIACSDRHTHTHACMHCMHAVRNLSFFIAFARGRRVSPTRPCRCQNVKLAGNGNEWRETVPVSS